MTDINQLLDEVPPCPCCGSDQVVEIDLSTEHYDGPGFECQLCWCTAPANAWHIATAPVGKPNAPQFADVMLKSTGYTVHIFDYDAEAEADINLAFPPYPQLRIPAPFLNGDYGIVDEVYWDEIHERFVVYLEQPKPIKRHTVLHCINGGSDDAH